MTMTPIAIFKRFIQVLLLSISFLLGAPVMAKSFTEVQHPEQVIEALTNLPDLEAPHRGSYTKKNPLVATLFAEQVGNQIEAKINISNPNSFEWFIKNEIANDAAINLASAEGRFLGYYPPGGNAGGPDILIATSDRDYDLLEPGDSIELNYSIPAEFFYTLGKGESIYIAYTNGGIPPSITEALANRYFVGKTSNGARIRCHRYDEASGQYSCEVEILPVPPAMK